MVVAVATAAAATVAVAVPVAVAVAVAVHVSGNLSLLQRKSCSVHLRVFELVAHYNVDIVGLHNH